MRVLVLSILSLGLALPAAAAPELKTEDDRVIYALGLAMARNLGSFELTDQEFEILQGAMADSYHGAEPKVSLPEYGPKINELRAARSKAAAAAEKKQAEAFVAAAAAQSGATRTESGIVYRELEPGSGEHPNAANTVEVHYHGTLRDGTVFDSSVERGKPASFALGRVIPCWTEAIQLMRVGGKAIITCPPDLAYRDQGAGSIPPGAALQFEVELLAIQ